MSYIFNETELKNVSSLVKEASDYCNDAIGVLNQVKIPSGFNKSSEIETAKKDLIKQKDKLNTIIDLFKNVIEIYTGTDKKNESSVQSLDKATIGAEEGDSSSQNQSHTIVYGDTLWAIAQKFLGNGARYTEIVALNNIADPNNVPIGTSLKIPSKEIINEKKVETREQNQETVKTEPPINNSPSPLANSASTLASGNRYGINLNGLTNLYDSSGKPLTNRDILTRLIWNEHHGSSESMARIAKLVINRVNDPTVSSNTLEGVLTQAGQFGDNSNKTTFKRGTPSQVQVQMMNSAIDAVMNGYDPFNGENVIFYCNPNGSMSDSTRSWFNSLKLVEQFESHNYYSAK